MILASVTSIVDDAFPYARALTCVLFHGSAPSNFTVYHDANQTGFSTPTWLDDPATALSTPPALVAWLMNYGYIPVNAVLSDPDANVRRTASVPVSGGAKRFLRLAVGF